MEFKALNIFFGNSVALKNVEDPRKVKISKSGLSFCITEDNGVGMVILKKDVRKIEYSNMVSTMPLLCLYLTKGGYSRMEKRMGLDKLGRGQDAKKRIYITFHVEYLCSAWISQPTEILSYLMNNFVQTTFAELEYQDVSKLLMDANHSAFLMFFKAESLWFKEYSSMSASEQSSYERIRNTENRKFSSYIFYIDNNLSKRLTLRKDFLSLIESLDTIRKMDKFLFSISWHKQMIIDQCLDFIADHQCNSPSCAKFSLLKCSACKVARYCDQDCQVGDSEHQEFQCDELKKLRKDRFEIKLAKHLIEEYEIEVQKEIKKDFLSFECFISKIRSKIFEHYGENIVFRIDLNAQLSLRQVNLSDDLLGSIRKLKNSSKPSFQSQISLLNSLFLDMLKRDN